MLDLSKELKENMAVSQDRVSCMVDAISDSIVRFDHQFASSPHSWAVFFWQSHGLPSDAVFFCMRRRETVCRYGWVDFRRGVCILWTHTLLLYSLLIVFINKGKGVCLWRRTWKILSPFAK